MILMAGNYFVGDISYVLSDSDYDLILEESGFFNLKTTKQWNGKYRGYPIFVASTLYGDGVYDDNYDRKYFVDAGIIGIVPIEALEAKSNIEIGNLLEFNTDFMVSYDNGVFRFGNVVIDTKNSGLGAIFASHIKEEGTM